jgi:exodeoxyribonuclease V alpha subunit
LQKLNRVRLLTAHREHTFGAAGLNQTINQHLQGRSAPSRLPNQPIIINRNDRETGLTNGSVGIVMEVGGVRAAYFPAASRESAPRRILLGQLPEQSPAWAMTIHRSQGSEFNEVVVILPRKESPLATRELLYTAITRARDCVHVIGSAEQVSGALGSRSLRCTLLQSSLAGISAKHIASRLGTNK